MLKLLKNDFNLASTALTPNFSSYLIDSWPRLSPNDHNTSIKDSLTQACP